MVSRIILVTIAATLLSSLTRSYSYYRDSTYTSEHVANAFDVTLSRMLWPGEYLTAVILPHQYTDMCCYDAEVLRRRWVVPALDITFNALIWSAVASAATLDVLRLRRQLGGMRALGYICISIAGLFLLCAAGNCWFHRDGVDFSDTSGGLAWSRFWEAFRFALLTAAPILLFGLWCVFRRRRVTDESPTI